MRSSLLIVLALLLTTAILAPSLITLIGSEDSAATAIDFNEEENKEEKKEVNEKDVLFNLNFVVLTTLNTQTSKIASFYIERYYSFLRTIFLPPPKYSS